MEHCVVGKWCVVLNVHVSKVKGVVGVNEAQINELVLKQELNQIGCLYVSGVLGQQVNLKPQRLLDPLNDFHKHLAGNGMIGVVNKNNVRLGWQYLGDKEQGFPCVRSNLKVRSWGTIASSSAFLDPHKQSIHLKRVLLFLDGLKLFLGEGFKDMLECLLELPVNWSYAINTHSVVSTLVKLPFNLHDRESIPAK